MEPSSKNVTLTAMLRDIRVAMEEVLLRRPRAWIAEARERLQNLPKTNFDLGCRFANEGKLFDAVFRFRIVIMLDKDYPNVWYNLGSCYFRMGRQKEAAEILPEALRRDPMNIHAKFMLAAVAPEKIPADQRPTTMPQDMILPFFSDAAAQYDITEAAAGYRAGALVHELLAPLVANAAPELLDLGCGTGIVSRPWRAAATRITGIDLTPAMIEFAGKATHADKPLFDRLVTADVSAIPHDVRADVIIAINLAHFLGDLRPLMRAVAEALNPQGLVAISIEPFEGIGEFGLSAQTARFGHSPGYVKAAAQAAGLVLVKEDMLEFYPGQSQIVLAFKKA